MSDITNTSPIVTENKLKDFYEDIKPFLGCPAYVTQEGNEMYFSTDEKVIGRWINGKPLYQKTIAITIGNGVQSVVYSFPEANIEYLIDYSGYIYWTSAEILPIPWYSDGDWNISAKMSNNRNVIISTHGYNGKSGYITVIYTKTTDSATTTIEQKPTHYSTDEQVVGTWIDGKPIYQKTLTDLNMKLIWYSQNFAWTNYFSPLFSDVDCFIDAKAITTTKSNIPVSIEQYNGQWAIRGVLDGTIITLTMQYTKTTD